MTGPPCYVALGDSMSIDLYPQMDLEEWAALSSHRGVGAFRPAAPGVGAASLFHRNDDLLWPEFAGRDLSHRHPGMERVDLCVDGATIGHTLDFQLPTLPAAAGPAARVVTLTAGGNDLLGALMDGLANLEGAARAAIARYDDLVARVLDTFPSAIVILTTVYDPTDGTGFLPGVSEQLGPLPLDPLALFNDGVRAAADRHDRARLADAHARFLGHGLSAPTGNRWYWEPSPIEPGARGASEIRRAWLDALDGSS
jgi:hypothetical protein